MKHTFDATVGPEGLDFESLEAVNAALRQLVGERVTVTFAPRLKTRSQRQLAWLWGVAYPLIADHLGYDRHEHERLHDDLLSVRFGTKAVQPLMEGAPPRIEPVRRTSDMTTVEFSDFMEWVVRFAAEKWDVYIPMPDDPEDARPR